VDDECRARACIDGACTFTFTPGDTVVTDQLPGNCHDTICNGAGGFAEGVNDADVPVDGNPCTDDQCVAGVATNPPSAQGTPCDGDGLCDGMGTCVACLMPSDCPGMDTECATRTCTAGACGTSFAPSGTPTAVQAAGDCHTNQCDGAGSIVNAVDDTDADDLNECTSDLCTQGVPTHTPLPDTTPCTGGECNMGFCCAIGQVCG
jgi:hypothetical protein